MPEGNEIHRWARIHRETFVGKKICVETPNGRFPDAALLSGRKLKAVIAHGKHLGYDFGPNLKLHVHLGRFGDFVEGTMPFPEARGALRMRWSTNTDWLELRGATDCSVFSDLQWKALENRLGADPLAPGSKPGEAVASMRKANLAIGALLMEQSLFAGIGNIYRAELLYRAKWNPFTAGKDTPEKVLRAVWKDAVKLMPDGMVDRRIVTTRAKDRPHPNGKAQRGETHYVYRRHGQPCFVCGNTIQRVDLAGRTLYWCPTCQPDETGAERAYLLRLKKKTGNERIRHAQAAGSAANLVI
jgi:endonuclease VIII